MKRIHIQRGSQRTTITISNILYELLAIKHNIHPHSDDAHKIIRLAIQNLIDKNADSYEPHLSQWTNRELTLELIEPRLKNGYQTWLKDKIHKEHVKKQAKFNELE